MLPLLHVRLEEGDENLILRADADDPEAQCDLAMLFLEQGFPDRALPWLERAAQRWFPAAMYWLGRCLIAGEGRAADEAAGIAWIAKAAQHGHAVARRLTTYLGDPARPALGTAELDAALDAIERELILGVLKQTAEPAG